MNFKKIKSFGFIIFILPSLSYAKILLIDSSLSDTLASFSVLTGKTYISSVESDDKFNLNIQNTSPLDAQNKLEQLLKDNGFKLTQVSEDSFRVTKDNLETFVDSSSLITKKIYLGSSLSQRAVEQLVSANPTLKSLKIVSSGVSNNEIIAIGTTKQLGQLQSLIVELSPLNTKVNSSSNIENQSLTNSQMPGVSTRLVDLKYADSASVGKTLQQLFSKQQMPLTYAIHEDANQIVLAGDRDLVDNAALVIEGMDRKPRQVYVDAIIAEVSDSVSKQFGAQLSGSSSNAGITYSNSTDTGSIGNINSSTVLQNISGGVLALGTGAGVLPDLGVILSILEGDGDTRILATPSIMTTENKESEILVGQNVPLLTGQYVNNSTTSSSPFQTIERKDLGTMLRIKPRIGAQGQINLDIKQEVSRIDSATSGLSDVATIKREISTTVNLFSGETIAIGGLRDKQEEMTESRIPLIGDIPVLGYLFRQETSRTVTRNLMIFLKPTIVSDAAERKAMFLERANDVDEVVDFIETEPETEVSE